MDIPAPAAARAVPKLVPRPGNARSMSASLDKDLAGIVHILTCGSVDDGKSTLIGRLLWDATDLYDDQRATLERSDRRAADSDLPDFSLLVDGLVAEREQGITIDIAWRYVDTDHRRLVIINLPGHEQYTRNMASGASHADVALLLIDARHGIKRQTRRHAAILDLMGVKRVVLAVNKMDLVGWSEQRFTEIARDFRKLAGSFSFGEALAIPACAVTGDNVARRSDIMTWYEGPSLLEYLDTIDGTPAATTAPFRMPVQSVLRDGRDFRGLAGTVRSGTVAVGETVFDALSGRSARVKRIATMSGDLPRAIAGQSVALQLDSDIDVSRGAILSVTELSPVAALSCEARMVWLAETPFDPKGSYLLRTATDLVPVSAIAVTALVDLETLLTRPGTSCNVNDIAEARLDLGRRAALDRFREHGGSGAVVLVDAVSGASVAGGVILAAHSEPSSAVAAAGRFVLTRDALARGLCRDLGDSLAERVEFDRRLAEVALLLKAAGVDAVVESEAEQVQKFDPVI